MSIYPEKRHITKAEINQLPMKQYEGPIHLCRTPEEAEKAISKLKKETLLGFDTETRPAFRKGESYDPSLLQLATETEVYLFQIQQTGLTPGLLSILANPDIVKAGVAIDRDISDTTGHQGRADSPPRETTEGRLIKARLCLFTFLGRNRCSKDEQAGCGQQSSCKLSHDDLRWFLFSARNGGAGNRSELS